MASACFSEGLWDVRHSILCGSAHFTMLSSILPSLTDAHIQQLSWGQGHVWKRDWGYWAREDSNTQEAFAFKDVTLKVRATYILFQPSSAAGSSLVLSTSQPAPSKALEVFQHLKIHQRNPADLLSHCTVKILPCQRDIWTKRDIQRHNQLHGLSTKRRGSSMTLVTINSHHLDD